MYFYIFFVVYVANHFSNGLIFETNPLDENKELIGSALPQLMNYFNVNKKDTKGMKLEEFANMLKELDWVQKIPHETIEILFIRLTRDNGLMNFDQFKKIATLCIRIYEEKFENHFKIYSNNVNEMTLKKLKIALNKIIKLEYTNTSLIKLMNHFEGEGAQVISMEAFRNILGFLLRNILNIKKLESIDNIHVLFR
ncbi:uncharacterized protein LOC126901301 isoform X2 [Daktulosphaira vitifoliae]|uniref:uncharacterized protein LOC126901301 isoform X2 n=1 Tax=Daktulosphaira vitifoliae TaxID=58002 RepID=UPI0021A9A892|nr:uncharacterized protein LOC126901301 isoform X2 [Daktulosphaira vitifoliae]